MKKIILLTLIFMLNNFHGNLLSSVALPRKITLNTNEQKLIDLQLFNGVYDDDFEVVSELIKYEGANANRIPSLDGPDADSQTYYPLHIAVMNRNSLIVQILLEYGADANVKDLTQNQMLPFALLAFPNRAKIKNEFTFPSGIYQNANIQIFNMLFPKLDLLINENQHIYSQHLVHFAKQFNPDELSCREKRIHNEFIKYAILQLLLKGADPRFRVENESFFSLAKNNKDLQQIYEEYKQLSKAETKKIKMNIQEALPEMLPDIANIIAEYVHSSPEME